MVVDQKHSSCLKHVYLGLPVLFLNVFSKSSIKPCVKEGMNTLGDVDQPCNSKSSSNSVAC